MKNCAICYFSGTGNTRFVAERIYRYLSNLQVYCELIPIEDVLLNRRKFSREGFDTIGIGFPVHAMDAPRIVYDFLELISLGRFDFFLFKSAGDPIYEGGSFLPLRRKLMTRGGRCIYEDLFVLPPNVGYERKPEAIKHLAKLADKQAALLADDLVKGIVYKQRDLVMAPVLGIFARLEKHGCTKLSDKWQVSDACIHCGKCVRQCPTKNIKQQGKKLVFGTDCVFCMRCAMNCPVRAIRAPLFGKLVVKPYDLDALLANETIPADYYKTCQSERDKRIKRHFERLGLL
ncbi:MAG: EFR1 family ferrodoxin [Candidatus Cloacimonadaceae bacterium]|nr:EFR1 family ferrodoxin [Candidatus Cloacimonadaceae bacterium]